MLWINYGHVMLVARLPRNIWWELATSEPKMKQTNVFDANAVLTIHQKLTVNLLIFTLRFVSHAHWMTNWSISPTPGAAAAAVAVASIRCIKYTFYVIRRDVKEPKKCTSSAFGSGRISGRDEREVRTHISSISLPPSSPVCTRQHHDHDVWLSCCTRLTHDAVASPH